MNQMHNQTAAAVGKKTIYLAQAWRKKQTPLVIHLDAGEELEESVC